jgi:hypothetical protein
MRWRGRDLAYKEQVANACDDFVDLTPATQEPAIETRENWSALIPGQAVPMIGEQVYGYDCQEDDGCPRGC